MQLVDIQRPSIAIFGAHVSCAVTAPTRIAPHVAATVKQGRGGAGSKLREKGVGIGLVVLPSLTFDLELVKAPRLHAIGGNKAFKYTVFHTGHGVTLAPGVAIADKKHSIGARCQNTSDVSPTGGMKAEIGNGAIRVALAAALGHLLL